MRMLAADGWDVRVAPNGRVALELVASHEPAIILLDLMMPLMDGFEFANTLRRNNGWRHIPVIVLTAKELTQEDRRRLNGDVQRILQKAGSSREKLLREIRELVTARATVRAQAETHRTEASLP
jgi:CheY-like chemotaxis protein